MEWWNVSINKFRNFHICIKRGWGKHEKSESFHISGQLFLVSCCVYKACLSAWGLITYVCAAAVTQWRLENPVGWYVARYKNYKLLLLNYYETEYCFEQTQFHVYPLFWCKWKLQNLSIGLFVKQREYTLIRFSETGTRVSDNTGTCCCHVLDLTNIPKLSNVGSIKNIPELSNNGTFQYLRLYFSWNLLSYCVHLFLDRDASYTEHAS